MIVETTLWAIQALLLWGMLRYSMTDSRNELHRLGNPLMWFGLFYILWFLMPQVLALMPGHLIIGLEETSSELRGSIILQTQLWLILFMLCVLMGYAAVTLAGGWRVPASVTRTPLQRPLWVYAIALYCIGLVGFHMMGDLYSSLGPGVKRSAIVKNASGKAYATLSFLASWATAYLSAHLWLSRRRMLAVAIAGGYIYFAFFTDARGRMMWPLVQATMFVWLQQGNVNIRRVALYGVCGMIVLVLLDPMFISFKNGNAERLTQALDPAVMLSSLFFSRNFDGFSNMALITHLDRIPEDLSILWTGARDAYMNTYFPGVYAMGVAFPTTFPGEAWIAGKAPIMVAFGLMYGVLLGALNAFIKKTSRESAVWVYLMAIPYLAGVGNDFVPSFGKMLAAMFAPTCWLLYELMLKRHGRPNMLASHAEA